MAVAQQRGPVAEPGPHHRGASAQRHGGPSRAEQLLFSGAMVLSAIHALDYAFVDREPGTSAGEHLASGLIPAAIAALLIVACARLRAWHEPPWLCSVERSQSGSATEPRSADSAGGASRRRLHRRPNCALRPRARLAGGGDAVALPPSGQAARPPLPPASAACGSFRDRRGGGAVSSRDGPPGQAGDSTAPTSAPPPAARRCCTGAPPAIRQ
jgi:hypothetical protein